MARRSGRFKAVDEVDDDIEVEDQRDDKVEGREEAIDEKVDDGAMKVENAKPKAGSSKRDELDEVDDVDEEEEDAIMAEPAHDVDPVENANEPEVEEEIEIEANTSIGSTRPSRKAAQEATKKIEAGKIKIEDNASTKGKGKGKGKAKVISDSEDSEEEEEDEEEIIKVKEELNSDDSDFDDENIKPIGKGNGKKKQILAKAVHWKDIPKWEKGSKSLLMELPGDVMDNIFGLREELGLVEYVALAGVCKTFRHHLDDDFFQAVCLGKKITPKVHYDSQTEAWISKPEIKGNPLASAPFSRGGDDWRVPVPRKYTYTGNDRALKQLVGDQKPAISHYVPRGARPTWSQAQYTVYKEEKRATRAERWAVRKPTLDAIAKDINQRTSSKYRSITDGNRNRTVLGEVPGRKHGEPAIEKDEKGIPIIEKAESEEDRSDSEDESESGKEEIIDKNHGKAGLSSAKPIRAALTDLVKTAKKIQPKSESSGDKSQTRKRAHVSESELSSDEDPAPKRKANKGTKSSDTAQSKSKSKSKKTKSNKKWVVPDSSDESANELEYMREQGLKITHDYWPSPWRVMAAALVTSDRINKSNAIKTFKVTEAQLLTVKHHLVANPMNSKQPMQLFIKAAVQALALRAHGGIAGHAGFVDFAKAKTRANAARRETRILQMIDDGTYVHKREDRPIPSWEWAYGFGGYDDGCHCADCILMGENMSLYHNYSSDY